MPFTVSVDGSGMKPLAPQALPADFPAAKLVVPEQVVFKAADGTEIHGQLFKPANASGKMPAIVFMHGGPVRQMLLGWHYLYYYHNSYAMNQYLASRGYMVLSVNYRSGIGYGRGFRMAQQLGYPIVPVSIVGSFEFNRKDRWWLHPSKIVVHIHDTIETKGMKKEDVPALCERVRGIVTAPVDAYYAEREREPNLRD